MARPRALITGASAGIGAAYARRLARDGHDLILVARRTERLNAMAEELGAAYGAQVEVMTIDLGDPVDVAQVELRLGGEPPVDLLINNAGFAASGAVEAQDPSDMDEMVRVNVMSLLRLTRAALPGMLERGAGSIINVSSGSVFYATRGASVYMATKALILAFTRGLHADMAARGIRVQALVPGVVATEFFGQSGDILASMDPSIIMQPDDLVEASLVALRTGEVVCIPSLPEYEKFQRYEDAEVELLSEVSKDHIAARYRT